MVKIILDQKNVIKTIKRFYSAPRAELTHGDVWSCRRSSACSCPAGPGRSPRGGRADRADQASRPAAPATSRTSRAAGCSGTSGGTSGDPRGTSNLRPPGGDPAPPWENKRMRNTLSGGLAHSRAYLEYCSCETRGDLLSCSMASCGEGLGNGSTLLGGLPGLLL